MKNFVCEFCDQTCKLKNSIFICTKCNKLNKLPENVDYFTYFNLPISFPVNLIVLEKAYLNLLSLYHPDNFVSSSSEEQYNAVSHSSFINQAYLTLKSNKRLVIYMYNLLTGEKLDTERGENLQHLTEFFFNLNEEFNSLKNRKEKNDFRNKIQIYYNDVLEEISNSFRIKDYNKIKNILFNKLSYIDKLQDRLKWN